MKKRIMMAAAVLGAGFSVHAQKSVPVDSLKVVYLQEVQVVSTRATAKTPIAFTNVQKEQIAQKNFGQDIPYLLNMTPSAITTSDAGTGIGYTTLRVRGTDATRINVTVNGIPLNDAESHNVFWVNMPDFASSVKDIQVQRGAGTSTNGAGAFGASVNMQTGEFFSKPYAEISGSFGSFNTHKETVKAGTGLLNGHWTFDARLSDIGTDGYIDRASVALRSYYLQGGFYTDRTFVKLIAFGGKERTYHAWNYAGKEEMAIYGRRYNSCGFMYATDKDGKTYSSDTYEDKEKKKHFRSKEGGSLYFYDDQTDNYTQTHFQLLFRHFFLSNAWNMEGGMHYTLGDGYYQEYKQGRTLKQYALKPYALQGETIKKSDLIRKKEMDNGFGGAVFSLNYDKGNLQASLGGGLNRYKGHHFGKVLWVKNYIGELNPDNEYYRNKATKDDGNIYLKVNYQLFQNLNAYGDLQYRHISYKIDGKNDKWNDHTDALQELNIHEKFNFFNPKAGLSWQINNENHLYGSFSVVHKEPTRNNYTDGKLQEHPKAERLFDYELGYTYTGKRFTAGVNLYYMDYKDQLVLTGELNEIGEAIADNVPNSYRMGVELMAELKLPYGFRWDINATLSRNRIKDFSELLYEDGWTNPMEIKHGDTPIAFSPDFLLNNRLGYTYKGFEAAFQTRYVSKQYMSNAKQKDQVLDAYFVSNLNLSYTFRLPHTKSITVGCSIYNLFNEEYENNGFAASEYKINDKGQKIRENYAGYAAQAGTNALAHISLKF